MDADFSLAAEADVGSPRTDLQKTAGMKQLQTESPLSAQHPKRKIVEVGKLVELGERYMGIK